MYGSPNIVFFTISTRLWAMSYSDDVNSVNGWSRKQALKPMNALPMVVFPKPRRALQTSFGMDGSVMCSIKSSCCSVNARSNDAPMNWRQNSLNPSGSYRQTRRISARSVSSVTISGLPFSQRIAASPFLTATVNHVPALQRVFRASHRTQPRPRATARPANRPCPRCARGEP